MPESAQFRSQATQFLNFCRLEKGLAVNSMDAYSADLSRFIEYTQAPEAPRDTESLRHYLDHLYQSGLGNRSVARHLTTLRNFYAFLLRENQVEQDPTQHLRAARQWQTIPKFLNLEEINRLIEAPDISRPNGLRDRAMLQLLYATGLRVSELCRVGMADLDISMQVVKTTGKGNKQRLIPVGTAAIQAVETYLAQCRPGLMKGRASKYLFVTSRGGPMTRQCFWMLLAGYGRKAGIF